MAISIKKGKEHKQSKQVRAAIFGKSGTHKTSWAITDIKRGVMIDYERGLGDLSVPDDLTIMECYEASDYRDALDHIAENIDQYDTLIVDSKTAYGDKLFVVASEMYPDKKDAMNIWQLVDTVSRQRFEQLLSLDINVIMVFLEEEVVLDNGFRGTYMSYKAKKFKASLEAKFDILVRSEKDVEGNVTRDSAGSNVAIGKNRFASSIGNEMTNFESFQSVINAINKQGD